MKPVRFHDAARAELIAETQYYATISPRLAERLFTAVEHATQVAAEFPEMGSPYKFGARRSRFVEAEGYKQRSIR